jgi:hypothetical protein
MIICLFILIDLLSNNGDGDNQRISSRRFCINQAIDDSPLD